MALSATVHAGEDTSGIGRFDISRFEVGGNTILAQQAIDELLKPFTGPQRNFGDVQVALETLEQVYHRLGYNVVQVTLPEQELNQGVVKLQVVETKLGKVRVEGNQYVDTANVRRSLPQLREGTSPNLGRVSSSLKLANENPAKKTSLQLQSGSDDELEAILKVSDERPWKLGASIDNTGNSSTGNSHVTFQFQHANVANLDHVLSLQYTTTIEKPSQVSVYGAGYHLPLYALGDSIDLFASYSDVDSGLVAAGLLNLQVSGRGSVYGARYNQNLRRRGEYESKLIYGIDYKAYQNNVALEGQQLGNDVTVHPFSLTYAGSLGTNNAEASFSVTALHNIPGGSRGSSADFAAARSGARAGYNMLRYTAAYSRVLARDWQMRLSLGGQYTNDALISGEQFGAGGATSVRGFQERDISNDKGTLFNAELYTPNLCTGTERLPAQCRALVFYDAAQASRNKALAGETVDASIASVGVGLRVSVAKYLALQADVGRVVDAGTTQATGDSRVHFRLNLSY